MPHGYWTCKAGNTWKSPRVGTINQRAQRFRTEAALIAWGKREGTQAKNAYILGLIPDWCKDPAVNSTKGFRDLDKNEKKAVETQNKGKMLSRARNAKQIAEAKAAQAADLADEEGSAETEESPPLNSNDTANGVNTNADDSMPASISEPGRKRKRSRRADVQSDGSVDENSAKRPRLSLRGGDACHGDSLSGSTSRQQRLSSRNFNPQLRLHHTRGGKVVPGKTVLGKTVSGKTMSGKPMLGRTVLGQTVPGKTVPGKTVPGKTVPGKTVPGKTVPGKILPRKTVPSTFFLGSALDPSLLEPQHNLGPLYQRSEKQVGLTEVRPRPVQATTAKNKKRKRDLDASSDSDEDQSQRSSKRPRIEQTPPMLTQITRAKKPISTAWTKHDAQARRQRLATRGSLAQKHAARASKSSGSSLAHGPIGSASKSLYFVPEEDLEFQDEVRNGIARGDYRYMAPHGRLSDFADKWDIRRALELTSLDFFEHVGHLPSFDFWNDHQRECYASLHRRIQEIFEQTWRGGEPAPALYRLSEWHGGFDKWKATDHYGQELEAKFREGERADAEGDEDESY